MSSLLDFSRLFAFLTSVTLLMHRAKMPVRVILLTNRLCHLWSRFNMVNQPKKKLMRANEGWLVPTVRDTPQKLGQQMLTGANNGNNAERANGVSGGNWGVGAMLLWRHCPSARSNSVWDSQWDKHAGLTYTKMHIWPAPQPQQLEELELQYTQRERDFILCSGCHYLPHIFTQPKVLCCYINVLNVAYRTFKNTETLHCYYYCTNQ